LVLKEKNMTWFSNLAIRKKLAVGFGALLAITLLFGLFALAQMASINSATEEIASKRMFAVRYLTTIRGDVNATRRTELTWLLVSSKQEVAEYDAKLGSALQKLLQDIKDGQDRFQAVAGEEDRRLYQQFQAALQNCVGLHGQVLALRQAGKEEEARRAAISQQPLIDAMFDAIDQVIAQSGKDADAAAQKAASEYQRARSLALVLLTLAIAAGILLTIVVSSAIAAPLRMLVAGLNQGAEGDLSARINTTSQDEVGQTSSAFNIFMEELQSVMQQVVATAEHVASATEEISASATQSANGSEAQRDQVHQVATAMQEMSATVHEVSENSNKAADSARQTAETARQGGGIVEDTLAHMRSIAGSVRETAQKVQELGSRSDQIGKIVGVIDDIADQTNLLALNAAIEAARAGEQGRGFAVVADEVRKLAERTTKATKEIAEMIQSVQADTRGAVDKMQSGTQQVEKGVEVTAKAGESLKQIIGQAEHVGEMVTHIATAANEQSSTTETVNANMDQINKLVAESAEGAQQSAQACEQLSSLALELQNLVSRFKLGNGASGSASGYRSPRQAAADPSRVRTALALAPRPPVQHDLYQTGHDRNGD